MAKPRHEIIQEIIEKAGSTFISVVFLKKDGTERSLRFNPRDFSEIKGTGTASSDPNIFRIREVQNKEEGKTTWRSFDARRVLKIVSLNEITTFKNIEA